jgi:formiminoglutamase
MALNPPTIELGPQREDDPRVGHLLGGAIRAGDAPRVVLVGFPTDEGVRRNGGRVGAAAAPTEIRRWLYRMTPDPRRLGPFCDVLAHTLDLGDMVTSADLATDQERLGDLLGPHLAAGHFVIVLGGGHETAYGHFLGYVRAGRRVGLLNLDAHADVRLLHDGLGHSGSPFREALEHPSGLAADYQVAGLLPQSVAAAHVDYVQTLGGRTTPSRDRALFRADLGPRAVQGLFAGLRGPTLASFDIDAADQAHAPGVSAPATGGLPIDLWLLAAFEAGRSAQVSSFDVVETNPAHDRDGQTARLAALTVWTVLAGLTDRRPRRPTREAQVA